MAASDLGNSLFRDSAVRAGTNFQPPIREIRQLLDLAPAADRTLVYMLTDGEASDGPIDVAGLANASIEFYAFQIGSETITPELGQLRYRPVHDHLHWHASGK